MKRIYLTLFTAAFTLSGLRAGAQEAHFTQYFASPLGVNPANTGSFGEGTRVATNLRQQWFNVGQPYTTYSLSAETSLANDLTYPNVLAVGAMVINDVSLGGALRTLSGSLSMAYQKSLDADGVRHLGMGVQATYTNTAVDWNKLSFASQYNGSGFDPSLPANVTYAANSSSNVDVSAGLLFSSGAADDPMKFYAGAAVYHILQPEETLFNETGSRVWRRYTAHAGAQVRVSEVSDILLSGIYNRQARADETIAGAAWSFSTALPDTRLYAGLWYRIGDAYMPYVGISTYRVAAGVNYSLPAKTTLGFRPRAFELSFILTLKTERSIGNTCPF